VTSDEFDEEIEKEEQFNCRYCQRNFMSDKGLKIHVGKSHKDLRKEKKPDSVEIKKLDHSRDFACAQPRNGNVLFSQDFFLSFYIMSIYLAYISFLAYILFRSAVGHFIFVYFVIFVEYFVRSKKF